MVSTLMMLAVQGRQGRRLASVGSVLGSHVSCTVVHHPVSVLDTRLPQFDCTFGCHAVRLSLIEWSVCSPDRLISSKSLLSAAHVHIVY
jgi:hypothetical protein